MECKRCKTIGTVMLRRKDFYCDDCFVTNTNHKFRACIGKSKILSKNEKVLVCLSGGAGSTVLLQLISSGLSMDSHKKLRIVPFFLHVIGPEENCNSIKLAHDVIKHCKRYNFNVYLVHVSQFMEQSIKLPELNWIPPVRIDSARQFSNMVNSMAATTINDIILKIKRHIYLLMARTLQCNFIFTAETTTTLSINLLSNLALGRGSQVGDDVGFCDSRHENIKILRPMKDITAEELSQYITIKGLGPVYEDEIHTNKDSLQSIIGSFVVDLQENFPATISTVSKTADKIGFRDEPDGGVKCLLCESDLYTGRFKVTALDATKFSRTVSNGNLQLQRNSVQKGKYLDNEKHNDDSLFPHMHKHLCYTCSKNYFESNKFIPAHIQKLLKN